MRGAILKLDRAAVEHGFEDFQQLRASGYQPGYDLTESSTSSHNRAVIVLKRALRTRP